MKKYINVKTTTALAVASVALFTGCCSKTEYGVNLTEPAEVYDTCFVPKGHGSDVAVGYSTAGKGEVIITPIDVNIPERYAVVFKCQHGKFVIDGERGEACYKKLENGDHVTVTYCEKFEVTKNTTNCIGLHFIDATKVNQ